MQIASYLVLEETHWHVTHTRVEHGQAVKTIGSYYKPPNILCAGREIDAQTPIVIDGSPGAGLSRRRCGHGYCAEISPPALRGPSGRKSST